MRPVLTHEALMALAASLPQWTVAPDQKSIHRELVFRDFTEAFAFMTEVAAEAERTDHHPEWSNIYNRVSICLTTHDSDGVTVSDLSLAKYIDAAEQGLKAKNGS